jgi:uncharacterized protein YcbK (DUF882 family)
VTPVRLSDFLDESKGDILQCACGCGFGTRPSDYSQATIAMFLELRHRCGFIHVLSWCRCTAHNAAVGGEPHSLHMSGHAADLATPFGLSTEQFALLANAAIIGVTGGLGGLGRYPVQRFIHIDDGFGVAAGRRWTRA